MFSWNTVTPFLYQSDFVRESVTLAVNANILLTIQSHNEDRYLAFRIVYLNISFSMFIGQESVLIKFNIDGSGPLLDTAPCSDISSV